MLTTMNKEEEMLLSNYRVMKSYSAFHIKFTAARDTVDDILRNLNWNADDEPPF